MWAAQPTYRRVWGQASLFYVYALKSILVHSETNNIILKTIRTNYNWGMWLFSETWGGYSPPSPPASYASALYRCHKCDHLILKGLMWRLFPSSRLTLPLPPPPQPFLRVDFSVSLLSVLTSAVKAGWILHNRSAS